MRLGVLGGTFDPIHVGHLILGEETRVQLGLDRVLYLPAGDPWRKAGRRITPREHRLTMVQLATADNPYFGVSRIEIDEPGPSYTSNTLARLLEEYGPETDLYFILGRDALADLPNWRNPAKILALARLAVAERPGWSAADQPETEARIESLGGRIIRIEMPEVAISATRTRVQLARGHSVRYQIPDLVLNYITERGLYIEPPERTPLEEPVIERLP